MEIQQTGFSPPAQGFSWHSHYSLTSAAPLAGMAVLQTTCRSKILCKSFFTSSIPVHTFYATHYFQLRASFPEVAYTDSRLGIQCFSHFLPPFLCLPTPSVLAALSSQALPYESEEAVTLPKTDVINSNFYRKFALAP